MNMSSLKGRGPVTRDHLFVILFGLQAVWLLAILYLFLRPAPASYVPPSTASSATYSTKSAASGPSESAETSESLNDKALVARSQDGAGVNEGGGQMPLTSLEPVTDNSFASPSEQPFSISGQVFEFGFLQSIWDGDGFAVFDLDGSYRTLEFKVGMFDDADSFWNDDYNHILAISADGSLLVSERWRTRPNVKALSIDLNGVKSLAIKLSPGLAIAEPMLRK